MIGAVNRRWLMRLLQPRGPRREPQQHPKWRGAGVSLPDSFRACLLAERRRAQYGNTSDLGAEERRGRLRRRSRPTTGGFQIGTPGSSTRILVLRLRHEGERKKAPCPRSSQNSSFRTALGAGQELGSLEAQARARQHRTQGGFWNERVRPGKGTLDARPLGSTDHQPLASCVEGPTRRCRSVGKSSRPRPRVRCLVVQAHGACRHRPAGFVRSCAPTRSPPLVWLLPTASCAAGPPFEAANHWHAWCSRS